jgi:opacity protein-like surface antigen
MKTRLVIAIAILFAFSAAAFAINEWVEVTDNRFSIMFPKMPETSEEEMATEAGDVIMKMRMLETEVGTDDNLVYGVITATYDSTKVDARNLKVLDKFYKGAIEGAVNSVKGKLLSSGKIMLGKTEGREIRIGFMEGVAIIHVRCYLVTTSFIPYNPSRLPIKKITPMLSAFTNRLA